MILFKYILQAWRTANGRHTRRICFVTNYGEKYWQQAFGKLPFTLPQKPICDQEVREVVADVRAWSDIPDIFIKTQGQITRIPQSHIVYVESNNRILTAHTNYKAYMYYYHLCDIEKELQPEIFYKLSRSHIINLQKVKGICHEVVEMDNGHQLYVPLGRRKSLVSALSKTR